MSTFEREGYQWRKTYFVFFDSVRRPNLKQMERVLHKLSKRFELEGGTADADGAFESISILSESDFAAVDISFEQGDEVREQATAMAKEFKSAQLDPEERKQFERMTKCDARLDLLHFEHMSAETAFDNEDDEMLDPSTLLLVLDAMVELTGGIGIDPASGSLLSDG